MSNVINAERDIMSNSKKCWLEIMLKVKINKEYASGWCHLLLWTKNCLQYVSVCSPLKYSLVYKFYVFSLLPFVPLSMFFLFNIFPVNVFYFSMFCPYQHFLQSSLFPINIFYFSTFCPCWRFFTFNLFSIGRFLLLKDHYFVAPRSQSPPGTYLIHQK